MARFEFNTGRFYHKTKKQIIKCVEVDGPVDWFNEDCKQRIIFVDEVRQISGVIEMCNPDKGSVLNAYDKGFYTVASTEEAALV